MAGTYTTRQGDAWDAIAHRVYGSVKYTGWLMENNHPHLGTFRFQAGVVLQTPDRRRTVWRIICRYGGPRHNREPKQSPAQRVWGGEEEQGSVFRFPRSGKRN